MKETSRCPDKNVIYEVGYPPYTANVSMIQYQMGRWLTYFLLIVVILTIIIVTIYLIVEYSQGRYYEGEPVDAVNPDHFPGFDNNIGSSNNGVITLTAIALNTEEDCVLNNGIWEKMNCRCKIPYYGDKCKQQSHDSSMYYIKDVVFESIELEGERSLTFDSNGNVDPNSCTSKCNEDRTCLGVTYVDRFCSLITSNPIYKESGSTALVYKNGVRPINENAVFVNVGVRPLRFWLDRDDTDKIVVNNVSIVSIGNENVLTVTNDGLLIGIWSEEQIDPNVTIKNPGIGVFVDNPSSSITSYKLRLPSSFKNKNINVIYLRSSQNRRAIFT